MKKRWVLLGLALITAAFIGLFIFLDFREIQRYRLLHLPFQGDVIKGNSRIQVPMSIYCAAFCAVLEMGKVRIAVPGFFFDANTTQTVTLPWQRVATHQNIKGAVLDTSLDDDGSLRCDFCGFRFKAVGNMLRLPEAAVNFVDGPDALVFVEKPETGTCSVRYINEH